MATCKCQFGGTQMMNRLYIVLPGINYFQSAVTDYYTFAWFADFFVLKEFQGKGVAKQILHHILEHPWASRLRRIRLNTREAHTLYRQFEFRAPKIRIA